MKSTTVSFPSSSSSKDSPYTLVEVGGEYASKKYDTFLSFRGDDTRNNILGHLRAALYEKGLKTFVDDDKLSRGKHISTQLLQAIEDSSCSIVIISPNFASSSWCLDELVHIIHCMKTRAQIVIPVFYKVDPSDVRKQIGTFGEAFAKHETNFKDDLERVNNWRNALKEITSLAGFDLKNYRDEANFIREIVAEVSNKLTTLVSSKTLECMDFLKLLAGFFIFFICFTLIFCLVIVPIFVHITRIADKFMLPKSSDIFHR